MKRLVLGHLVYLYTPIGIVATTLGILKGGEWVWLGVAIFYLSIVLDTVTAPLHTSGAPTDKNGKPLGIPVVHNAIMGLMLPLFVCLQAALAWRVYQYAAGVPVGRASCSVFRWPTESPAGSLPARRSLRPCTRGWVSSTGTSFPTPRASPS